MILGFAIGKGLYLVIALIGASVTGGVVVLIANSEDKKREKNRKKS